MNGHLETCLKKLMSSNIVYIYFHENQSEMSPPHFISHSKSWLVGFCLGKCISSRHRCHRLPEADAKLRRKLACRAARAEAAGFVGEATGSPAAAEVQLKPLKEQGPILGLDGKFVGVPKWTVSTFFFSAIFASLLDLSLEVSSGAIRQRLQEMEALSPCICCPSLVNFSKLRCCKITGCQHRTESRAVTLIQSGQE